MPEINAASRHGQDGPKDDVVLECRGITKSFESEEDGGGVLALDKLDLCIKPGEFVTLLGPSGCGKTTLLHMLAGLSPYFPPDGGQLLLDGNVVRGPGADRGMVFQEYALLPWKSVQANVELPLKFAGVSKEARAEEAREYLRLVGLEGFEKRFPFQLSGGMRQRVAVARALINNPKVLLMDEPFAAVDAQTRRVLQEELTRVWEQVRNTVIFVTHSVEEALFLADRVIVLSPRPGRILADLYPKFARPRAWGATDSSQRWQETYDHVLGLITGEDNNSRTPA